MDEGGEVGDNVGDEKHVVVYEKTVAEPEKSISHEWRLIWIVVGVTVFLLILIVVFFSFRNGVGDVPGDETSDKVKDDMLNEMERCLEGDEFDAECNLLFSNVENWDNCNGLSELKDKCLYEVAIAVDDNAFCAGIDDSEVRTKCENEVIIFGEESQDEA